MPPPLNPPEGYWSAPVAGGIIGVCTFEQGALTALQLYPTAMFHRPVSRSGIPYLAEGETAEKTIAHLAELSAPFGTKITYQDGIGLVAL